MTSRFQKVSKTETTWTDEVMSDGIVIADGDTKKELIYGSFFIY